MYSPHLLGLLTQRPAKSRIANITEQITRISSVSEIDYELVGVSTPAGVLDMLLKSKLLKMQTVSFCFYVVAHLALLVLSADILVGEVFGPVTTLLRSLLGSAFPLLSGSPAWSWFGRGVAPASPISLGVKCTRCEVHLV
jgi:hypothetical protein